MTGSGREAFPDVWKLSGSHHGCPGLVRRPSRMSGSGRYNLRMSGSGREAFPDVRELSGGHPGCPGVVVTTSQMFGSGR